MADHIGRMFGEMALDMLFVTSGFLVTASLFNRAISTTSSGRAR